MTPIQISIMEHTSNTGRYLTGAGSTDFPAIQQLGSRALNRAFVLQNGIEEVWQQHGERTFHDWEDIEALFIGGDTRFKFSPIIAEIVQTARRRGVWIHMGRVNSVRRLEYACAIGCDSCDGSGMARFPDSVFDASPHELDRANGCSTYAVQDEEADRYQLRYPLQEWGWDLARCIAEIQRAGLPVPDKSSCYFCSAMKPWEVDALTPDKLRRIVIIEARATAKHLAYAERKGWPKGPGIPLTDGLWRKPVKGCRGATPKPGSMTEYIREKALLPSAEIDRLITLTPTQPLLAGDIPDWQSWLAAISAQAQLP